VIQSKNKYCSVVVPIFPSKGFHFLAVCALLALVIQSVAAQNSNVVTPVTRDAPWSVRMTNSFIAQNPDTIWYAGIPKSLNWDYERGVVLEGIHQVFVKTRDQRYADYIRKQIDQFVNVDGSIRTYDYSTFNLDNIATGRLLLALFHTTRDPKYKIAADTLRKQLQNQPRTREGGFWHKKIYPYQMWLDGLYMAEPFYAEYASTFNEQSNFDDIANQFIFMEQHARDTATGLLFHGWDESKQQRWANPSTGCSPSFWGRALGWYAMGLVDVLDWFPLNHPKRHALEVILQRLAAALTKNRDTTTGLWYQVVDKPQRSGNYPEASASCMAVYALAKGARLGYFDSSYLTIARDAFKDITSGFVTEDNKGKLSLHHTCQSSGLGNQPYRDGSYEYYMSEPQRTNDFKGIGAFIMAANELEQSENVQALHQKVVTLDCYFNCEWKEIDGKRVQYHYVWEDTANSGFSKLATIIGGLGAKVNELHTAPSADLLTSSSVYIIVDPDTPSETEHPNFIGNEDIDAITGYVNAGGILVLMGNDKGNSEFEHLNNLATRFGIHFNEDSHHRVVGNDFDTGKFSRLPEHPIFSGVKQIYLKEICSFTIKKPAESILTQNGFVFMTSARVGKGMVFAVGDPWLYNEYIDSRRLPHDYENARAGENLFRWLLDNAATGKR
jgi:unsaturated rhamnogalacturonyl hydrolase